MWLLLISLTSLFIGGYGQTSDTAGKDRVRVFSFQRGIWTVPTDEVLLRYDFPRAPRLIYNFSVCYRIRLEVFSPWIDVHLSYKNDDNNADPFYFGNTGTQIDSWFDTLEQPGVPTWNISPEVWRHLCHVFDTNTYKLYLDGKMVHRGDLKGNWPLNLNGTLILGQEQDGLASGYDRTQIFRGDMAQYSFWDYPLTSTYITAIKNCRDIGRGNLFSTDTFEPQNYGVEEKLVDLKNMCRLEQHTVILPHLILLKDARAECDVLNATLTVPLSDHNVDQLVEQIPPFMDICNPSGPWKLWLGLWDQGVKDEVWRNIYTNETATYLNFPDVSFAGSYRCVSLQYNGLFDGHHCDFKACPSCYFEETDSLYLRGLCFEKVHQSRFRVDGYINTRPYFRGFYGKLIYWNTSVMKWLLVDVEKNHTMLQMSGYDEEMYPVGRRNWEVVKKTCGHSPGKILPLSLSACEKELFMCDSGYCIPRNLRCNLRYDCGDGSDETGCHVIDISSDLRKDMPPSGPKGAALKVVPVVIITRIANVDDINMAITLEFELSFSWIDSRLKLRHLKPHKINGTILAVEEAERLWLPSYHFMNLEAGHKKLLSQSVLVTSAKNSSLPSFNSVNMDMVYPGSANRIALIRRYTARVTCYFNLYIYPFDEQTCSVDLELPSEHEGYVEFALSKGEAIYIGPEDLAMYAVKKMDFGPSSDINRLSLTFDLHRLQGVVFFSTFLPSAMLLAVSWATLFVSLQDLNVRAIMSLTTLLVLYTLFNNMSTSLPTTATIKLIDIWFFFIIFALFFNIMVHIFVTMASVPQEVHPHRKILISTANEMSRNPKPSGPSSIRFLRVYRIIGLPVIVLLFNIVFWSIVASQKFRAEVRVENPMSDNNSSSL